MAHEGDERWERDDPGPSGVPRANHGAEREDALRPPDEAQVRREINRSGSGGSGGAPEDPREEGSGSRSLEDMLAGDDG